MTHRLTEAELAELECNADIYPHIGVIQHLNLLRWAYEQIDRLEAALLDALPYVEDVLSNPEQLACFKRGVVQGHVKAIRAAIDAADGKAP